MICRIKKAAIAFFGTLCLTMTVFGQDNAPDTTFWKHGVVATLTATQVSFNDWSQGGEDAFSWTTGLDGKSVYEVSDYNWSNSYKLAYGQTKIGSQGSRKADDKIDLESILSYKMSVYVNPYVGTTLKTQFTQGYSYDALGTATPLSSFFDPGYLTQSAGFGYQPIPQVKTRLGAAIRETFTKSFNVYSDDPKTTEIEKTKVEGGFESVTDIEWKLEQNLLFKSKLELFAALKSIDAVVVRMDNTLTANISKYVVVNLNVQIINEKIISPRTQVKQTISFGLSYVLF